MRTLHVLFHLTRADFLERIRRSSFLITLATAVFAGYLFVPPVGAGYRVLQVGAQRGIYNSPWVGLMFGLIAAMHLPFVGFYLVKNAVERDRQTGVGQIIATTPIRNLIYVAGKWLSNLTVLVTILSVMTVMAAVMQLVRGEDTTVRLWALAGPIWLMGLPVLALAAAMAVLFECVRFLRGGLGNAVYFFVWLGAIAVVLSGAVDEVTDRFHPTNDPFGFTRSMSDIQGQVLAVDPDADVGSGLIHAGSDIERTFVWAGFRWTGQPVLERLIWVGIAVAIALVAAVPFDRFDPTHRLGRIPVRAGLLVLAFLCAVPLFVRGVPLQERLVWVGVGVVLALVAVFLFNRLVSARRHARVSDPPRLPHAPAGSGKRGRGPVAHSAPARQDERAEHHSADIADTGARPSPWLDTGVVLQGEPQQRKLTATGDLQRTTAADLTPVAAAPLRGQFVRVLAAELKLMLKGRSWLWYAGALGLNLACLLNPSDAVQRYLLLAVWVWPVLVWSQMGVRERRFNTEQIVFSVPRPALRQLPALWLAGVVVAVAAGSGAWLYLALMDEITSLLAWFVGALFVPALALALGVWVGHSRAFEAVYLLLWYVGPVEGVTALDYTGATGAGLARGIPLVYLGISIGLVMLAVLGRWRHVPAGA
jgi:hypothetical protein